MKSNRNRSQALHIALVCICLLLVGCSRTIEIIGSGRAPEPINGLQATLMDSYPHVPAGNIEINIKNISNNIISINRFPGAISIQLKHEGQVIIPSEKIIFEEKIGRIGPDEFVILAPNQTIVIKVPIFFEKTRLHTHNQVYQLKRDFIYEIHAIIHPYFDGFTKESADSLLSEYKIPNYLSHEITMNSLIVRIKPVFK